MIGMYAPQPYVRHICNFCDQDQHTDGISFMIVRDIETAICDLCVHICLKEILDRKAPSGNGDRHE